MGLRSANFVAQGWKRLVVAGCLVAGLAVLSASQGVAAGAGLLKVRFGGDLRATRIVLELAESTQAKLIFSGDAGLVLDLPRIRSTSANEGQGQGLVRAWSASSSPGSARVKIDLSRPAEIERRFLLAPGDGVPVYRYVIDLKASGAAAFVPARPAAPAKPPVQQAAARPLAQPVTPPRPVAQNGRRVIVIDAGHGGKDPGALGSAAREKDLTLAAARDLKARLERTGRYRVVLTRDTDVFVPLEDRVRIAQRAGADLFISLHADSIANPATRGASVYTLSDRGSQRAVTNSATNSNWFATVKPGPTQVVRDILFDLTQRNTRNRSGQFADLLLTRLSGQAPLLSRAHRDAGYLVLLAPDVPAVLLEMGYITNREDERFLADPNQRRRLTNAVAEAIDDYFAPADLIVVAER